MKSALSILTKALAPRRTATPAVEDPIATSQTGRGVHPAGRIPALDGIRGIAILFVMLYHFTLYGGMEPSVMIDKIYYRGALVGWFGVDLFFVLSGFLITGILFDSVHGRHYFRNFYTRRVLRIFPLYYGTLAVFFLLIPRLYEPSNACQQLLDDQIWYWTYLVNIQIAIDYWPECFVLGHFWSLAVEEQFYLLWPLVILVFRRRSLIVVCLLSIFGALVFRTVLATNGELTAAYALMPSRADALAMGALLALLARGPRGLGRVAGWGGPIIVTSAALLGVIFLWKRGLSIEDPLVLTVGFSLLVLLFGGTLLLGMTAPPSSRLGRFFSHPALVFFGRYSYGLYVFHHPIAIGLGKSGIGVWAWPRILGSQMAQQVGFTVLATALSLLIAMLSWHLYESPILRLKRFFAYDFKRG